MTLRWRAMLVATSMLALCAGTASAIPATEELNIYQPGGPGQNFAVQTLIPVRSMKEWLGCGSGCAGISGSAQVDRARIRLAQQEEENAEAIDDDEEEEEEADTAEEPAEGGFPFGVFPPGITIGPGGSDEDRPGFSIQLGK